MENLFEGFPNLHPLVVHFPIVLLLLALLSQVVAVCYSRYRRELNILTCVLLLLGTLWAFMAIQTASHISAMPMRQLLQFLTSTNVMPGSALGLQA